jgi:DNA-binding NarL/FixJ family response regulator
MEATPPPGKRTALLLDQHPVWLYGVEQVLERLEVTVLAKTSSPDEAIALAEELRPDVFVTGLQMPPGQMDGFTCIRLVRERLPECKVIVLSQYDDSERIEAAFAAGAVAYVVKTAHPDDVASAIRQTFSHSIYLPGVHGPAVMPLKPPKPAEDSPGLTRRELEILQLVSEGHSNAALARMLWVTEQTVKFHLSNIYRKLDVANRTEASRWAQVRGLLPATSPTSATLAASGR